jgi:uncharacterized protein DUF3471
MEGKTTSYRRAQPWTPSAADVHAFDGRYRSDELGTVFEILPGTNGLMLRFEQSADKAVELEPVAHDTYMQRMLIVRFLRDADGRVTGFDHSNPVASNIRFTRLGSRAGSSTAAPAAAAPAPATPPGPAPSLEGLAGEFEMAPGRSITITLESGQLQGQPSGGQKRTLAHVSGTTFPVAGTAMTLTFALGTDGRATAMVMRQNGNERTLQRVR